MAATRQNNRNNAAQTDSRTALARRRENGGQADNTLANDIRKMQAQYQLAMPKGAEAEQLVRDALTALRTTRNLDKCDSASVLGGLMTCAQLGLRPGVLGHAWLLPFWSGKDHSFKAQLVIGYQGLIELAHRSGRIASLYARTVFQNDEFDVDYGVANNLVHKPNLFEERGEPIAYYALVKFTNGGYAFYVMSHREMLSYRDQYATAKNREGKVFGPWVDNFEGMAHKTCVRQLAKYMPKSTELAQALQADDAVRVNVNPQVDPGEAADHDVIDSEIVEDSTEPGQPDAASQGEATPPPTAVQDPSIPDQDWPDTAQPGGAA